MELHLQIMLCHIMNGTGTLQHNITDRCLPFLVTWVSLLFSGIPITFMLFLWHWSGFLHVLLCFRFFCFIFFFPFLKFRKFQLTYFQIWRFLPKLRQLLYKQLHKILTTSKAIFSFVTVFWFMALLLIAWVDMSLLSLTPLSYYFLTEPL